MTRIAYLAAALALTAAAAADDGVTVELAVSGVIPGESTIYVNLCTEAEFMVTRCALEAMAKADAATLTFTFQNVPPGRYAAGAWWDVNDDAKMESGPYGEPLEPVALSNGAVGEMGPPKFSDAAVDVPASGPVTITFK